LQGTFETIKFNEAIRYYEPFVKRHQDELLKVSAMALANLCVSYIMTSLNEKVRVCVCVCVCIRHKFEEVLSSIVNVLGR
jgi:hypothetical protein